MNKLTSVSMAVVLAAGTVLATAAPAQAATQSCIIGRNCVTLSSGPVGLTITNKDGTKATIFAYAKKGNVTKVCVPLGYAYKGTKVSKWSADSPGTSFTMTGCTTLSQSLLYAGETKKK